MQSLSQARWSCPGYKKLTDLTFRNQNVIVAGNAPRPPAQKIEVSALGTLSLHTHEPLHCILAKPPGIPKDLNLDLESVARAYFLSRHVIVGSEALGRGQYKFLTEFLAKQQQTDKGLQHALNAAAFAAFGNTHNSAKMLQRSRIECNLAIQAVNTALKSPETAAQDSTVIAAMLLWTFEALTFVLQRDGKECIDQLTGGLALLLVRGPSQVDTHLGFQIFLQAYFLVITTCIQKEHALPPPSSILRTYVQPYLGAVDCCWRILDLMARFANFLDTLKDEGDQDRDGSLDLISTATKLDDDLQIVSSCMPANWGYQILQNSDPVLVYNGTYHIYHDVWTIRYWNYLRLCRIRLQQIILDNHYPDHDPSGLRYQTMTSTITQLSTDICATVPQHVGNLRHLQLEQMEAPSPPNRIISAQQETGPYTAGIYHVLWPLFAIGKMKSTPIQQRKWIISRLQYLGRISGISQAFAGAEILSSDESL